MFLSSLRRNITNHHLAGFPARLHLNSSPSLKMKWHCEEIICLTVAGAATVLHRFPYYPEKTQAPKILLNLIISINKLCAQVKKKILYNYSRLIIIKSMKKKFVFGLYVNTSKDSDLTLAKEIVANIVAQGADVWSNAESLGCVSADYSVTDAVITLGGDGTILRVAGQCAVNNIPILGLNLGRLGYLAESDGGDTENIVQRIMAGNYVTDSRMMLAVSAKNKRGIALNEVAVLKQDVSRTIELCCEIDGELTEQLICDGMLVATPTGSTGYSLSAGGPLIDPMANCMTITPICAHSLTARPLVIRDGATIALRLAQKSFAGVAIDGEQMTAIDEGDKVVVTKSEHSVHFIRLKDQSFNVLLREKFLKKDTKRSS